PPWHHPDVSDQLMLPFEDLPPLSNIVFRGLRAGEDPSKGLVAKSPGAKLSPISHVAGAGKKQPTPWISTTRDLNIINEKYGKNNGYVEMDVSKVKTEIVDFSNGIPGMKRGMVTNWAKHDKEVLIRDRIPAEAIRAYHPKK